MNRGKLRQLPSVDRLLGDEGAQALIAVYGHRQTVGALRGTLDAARDEVRTGADAPGIESLVAQQPDTRTGDEAAAVSGEDRVPTTYEGAVELNILPPLVPGQLVEIQRYLRDWPGIGITELKPSNNGYSITISLNKPIQLVDILKQLPAVEDARECAADEAEVTVGGAPSQDGLRRIAVTVCAST